MSDYQHDPTLPKGYLSPSAITSYEMCPRAYAYQYVEKVIIPRYAPEADEGTLIHRVAEAAGQQLLKGRQLPSAGILLADWKRFAAEEKDGKRVHVVLPEAEERVRPFIKLLHARLKKDGKPAGIEEKLTGVINGVPMEGRADWRCDKYGITDYKVTKTAKSQAFVEKGTQFGVYSMLADEPRVRCVSFVKTKTPKETVVTATRSQENNDRTAAYIESVADSIRQGRFPFAPPDHWKCQQKFCDFWSVCPQGHAGRGRPAAVPSDERGDGGGRDDDVVSHSPRTVPKRGSRRRHRLVQRGQATEG